MTETELTITPRGQMREKTKADGYVGDEVLHVLIALAVLKGAGLQ